MIRTRRLDDEAAVGRPQVRERGQGDADEKGAFGQGRDTDSIRFNDFARKMTVQTKEDRMGPQVGERFRGWES